MEEEHNFLDKIKKIFREEKQEDAAEEIMSMIEEKNELGSIESYEANMIKNIFSYANKDAKDIMCHRKGIKGIDGNESLESIKDLVLAENISRFPVYLETIDNIVGTIHMRDVMNCYFQADDKSKPLISFEEYLRKPIMVPETKNIDKLFRSMQEEKIQMVIVLDEYGQTSGLISMEDILEEIVGNILDEYDEEELLIMKQLDDSYIVDGLTELYEIEKELHMEFDNHEFDTLNGFLISQLACIPEENTQHILKFGDYKFEILSVENNTIKKVRVKKL